MESGNRTFKSKTKAIVESFWLRSLHKADTESWSYKDLQLPLARIKRLMKVEEEVKMVASEVPILFSKVAEMFIEELTLRAWINTEENKRRILQKNDLSAAARTSDIYDFLIFIIPRNELDPGYTAYDEGQGMDDNIKPFHGENPFYAKHNDTLLNKQTMNHDYTNYSLNAPTAENNLSQHER